MASISEPPPARSGPSNSFRWAHLAPSPTALGWPAQRPSPSVYQDILKKLRSGLLWYDYYLKVGGSSIFSKFYPITIEEIHSGFVKGKERLITAHSGVYGWRDGRDLHFAYLSDGRGLLVPHNFLTTVDRSGVRTEITLRENEMAILKKIPVTLHSDKPVNLIAQQYDSNAIQLLLNGEGDVKVEVRDGDFQLTPLRVYVVVTDEKRTVTSTPDATLSFSLEPKGELKLRIERAAEGQ